MDQNHEGMDLTWFDGSVVEKEVCFINLYRPVFVPANNHLLHPNLGSISVSLGAWVHDTACSWWAINGSEHLSRWEYHYQTTFTERWVWIKNSDAHRIVWVEIPPSLFRLAGYDWLWSCGIGDFDHRMPSYFQDLKTLVEERFMEKCVHAFWAFNLESHQCIE